jgi:putative ABC transport system permease protein
MTMLGIVIGIMSVILVLSIGEAAQGFIVNQVAVFGSDLIFVENGANPLESEGPPSPFVKEVLDMSDIRKMKNQSWIRDFTAGMYQSDVLTGAGQDYRVQVVGTTEAEPDLYLARTAQGTFFSEDQVNSRNRVIVLGSKVAQKLFGQEYPVGRLVKLSGRNFRVLGVMAPAGTRFLQNVDDQAYIPYTAAMDLYNKKFVQFLIFKVDVPIAEAKRRIQIILREQHDILDPKNDDFNVSTQDDVVKQTAQITQILQILLGSVAGISLVVGGIGIMNIMYVSVTERVREIGLRKALGARGSDILGQFILEAFILTTLGGLVGTALGIGLTWLAIQVILQFQTGWGFSISVPGIFLGVFVSSAIGLIFGFAPARRASKLNPIVALRKE